MPSRHATKAALRRSMEPQVIPPAGVETMPVFCTDPVKYTGWRNPVRGEHYDRTLWEAFRVGADRAFVLASVQLVADGTFEVSSVQAFAKVADPQAAFELAAGWAMACL